MRWAPGDRGNIQDARGSSGMRMGSIGIGGFLVLLLLSWATGTDFLSLLGGGGGTSSPGSAGTTGELRTTPQEERLVDFVDAVAKDTQDTWEQLLGNRYQRTRVVLFRDAIESACGFAQSATGPFYCPGDRKVYLDLGFYDELQQRFGAEGGPLAEGYVVAHEYGHHIQNLIGNLQGGQSDVGAEGTAVRIELQADCFAGVWAHNAAGTGFLRQLTRSDVAQALDAASAVGDDRIQERVQGQVTPETWTHGSSEQRQQWFLAGYEGGRVDDCDTFDADL